MRKHNGLVTSVFSFNNQVTKYWPSYYWPSYYWL